MGFIESLKQDVRYGSRMLLKNPGFSLTVIITLGLGIGLNSALFSIADGALLRHPPVKNPERLVVLTLANPHTGLDQEQASALEFSALRQQSQAFGEIAAAAYGSLAMTGREEPELITAARISSTYFELFGIQALIGRTLSSREEENRQQSSAVISYDFWRRRFGSDPHVIGSEVTLGGESYKIVGVMPEQFKYAFLPCDAWISASFVAESLRFDERDIRSLYVIGRLKNGISIQQAQAETRTIFNRLAKENPSEKDWVSALASLKEVQVAPQTRAAILFLMGVVGFVLLVACANVAGLSAARAAARRNELVIRAALGAGRPRLIQQLLSESALLALLSGGFGILMSIWGIRFLRARMTFEPQMAWLASRIGLNGPVLLFALFLSVLTVLMFGLLPAIRNSRPDLRATINEGSHTASGSRVQSRLRNATVIGQIAMVTVLLACTGVAIRLVVAEARAQLGFDPKQVLTVGLALSGSKYNDSVKQAAFFSEAIERIRSLPGVQAVAATQVLPESFPPRIAFEVRGQSSATREEQPQAGKYIISSDYFRVMRIPLLKGRSFSVYEGTLAQTVAIINETLARQFFPDADPVGKTILTYPNASSAPVACVIVGVVGNVIDRVGETASVPQIYVPFTQNPVGVMTVVLRARGDESGLAPSVSNSIWAMDKNQPITHIETMRQALAHKGAGDRLLSTILGIFTGLALGLATIGIYGVVSYIVVRRTHEIGLRMALGARRRDVFRLVVGRGLFLVGAGIAWAFIPVMALLRFVIHPHTTNAWAQSSFILVACLALIVGAALLACYVPARRAMTVDPAIALRHE